MGIIEIKTSPVGYAYGEFNCEFFPKELVGIIPPKEYLRCMDVMSKNLKRNFFSILAYLVPLMYFFIGLIPALLLIIVEIIRWFKFKNLLKKDFENCLEYINKQVSRRGMKFEIKLIGGYFSSLCKLKITFPDIPPVILSQAITLDNGQNALIMEPYPDTGFFNDYGYINESGSPDLKIITIFGKKFVGWGLGGNKGFCYYLDLNLYNYLSDQEFKTIFDDFDNALKCRFNHFLTGLFMLAIVGTFFLFGAVLWIPVIIWYFVEKSKLTKKLLEKEAVLILKYNNLYNHRRITIKTEGSGFYRNLQIIIPSDVGNAPILTKFITNEQLVLSLNSPNGIAPIRSLINAV
ncbi:hypothetical protein RB653_001256 [Dictyostelium firmibasis]|uniref:Uncharacterized protein n=1 Tax=Dictyostelium firmibasis TaxID=79012 RepID=A0AAN7YWH6_9MYCE